jgi:flagellar M-ring protein FliF
VGLLGTAVDRLGSTARIVVGVIALVTIGVIAYIVMTAGGAAYTPAFTNLTPRQAGQVQAALAAKHISSQLAGGGTTVLVPSGKLDEAMVAAVTAGVSQDGSDGYAILDQTSLSTTDAQWQMRVQRARSAVLASQIEQISGISHADVNIAMPSQSIFTADQGQTTASVQIETTGVLTDDAVRGITALVAGAVPGLTAQNVAVTDQHGQLLNASLSSIGYAASDKLSAQRKWDAGQTALAQATLDRILGPTNSSVVVAGQLNFDQVTTRQQTFGANKGAINGDNETEKLVQQGGANGGVSGTAANVPGAAAINGASSSQYNHNKTSSTNAIDSTATDTTSSGGTPTQMSISMVVAKKSLENVIKGASTNATLQAQALSQLQGAVENAVGFDATNAKNTIAASAVETLPNPVTALKVAGIQTLPGTSGGVSGSGGGGGGITSLVPAPFGSLLSPLASGVVLLVFLFLVRKSLAKRQALLGSTDASWLPALEAPPIKIEELLPAMAGPSAAELQAVEKKALQNKVEDIATSRPADVAAQLRGWLASES